MAYSAHLENLLQEAVIGRLVNPADVEGERYRPPYQLSGRQIFMQRYFETIGRPKLFRGTSDYAGSD